VEKTEKATDFNDYNDTFHPTARMS